MGFLYRGVRASHPERHNAANGIVIPGNVHGTVTAEEHNSGGWSAISPFTSWTRDEALARGYACEDAGLAVLLRMPDWPTAGEGWQIVASPDRFGEQETLLHGIRIDIEVVDDELPCKGDGEAQE